ncbi:putative zinc finger/helix-turn-helix protein, YgiT family [Chryseobacterium nakagawai]|uniref:XRE family transcriptional regulator n=1 Tax=Chryseobacterium nakagawai TaxID=1241982 RepID=A0AAD0YQ09_CHRNA|nr:helix-turn-helix transcriptional regulator [Chryseobacterium nakagawai]AZA91186.1 XRE family transcriptional regulator [Chryseobacterium nakagawai]VEH22752.1 putative zinc finger/helix-turn-helix protein, YgiT family [Chryseobacterium nakagawai]
MNDKKLKELRKNAKLTQQELAELVGVDRRSIISYEKGESIPAPIAKLLHILLETDYLVRLSANEINYVVINEEKEVEINHDYLNNLISDLKTQIIEKIDKLSDQERASSIIDRTYLRSIITHFDIKPKEISEAENIEEKLEIKKQ